MGSVPTTGGTYPDEPGGYVGHYGGLIRNNVIYADVPYFDTGIELSQASGTKVFHNTIPHNIAVTSFFSSIDYRFANTSVVIRNNLVERITVREGAAGTVDHNLEGVALDLFANPVATTFTSRPAQEPRSTTG